MRVEQKATFSGEKFDFAAIAAKEGTSALVCFWPPSTR